MAPNAPAPGPSSIQTPNCALCSNAQEHTVCEVVRLVDGRWMVDRTPSFSSRFMRHASGESNEVIYGRRAD